MSEYAIGISCDHKVIDFALTVEGTSPNYYSNLLYPTNRDTTSIIIREFSATEGLTNFLSNINGMTNFSLDGSDNTLLHFNTLGFLPNVSYVDGSTYMQPPKLYLATYNTPSSTCPMCLGTNIRRDLVFDRTGSIKNLSGTAKVSQQVLKILVTSLESNRLHSSYGASLNDYVGQNLDLLLEFTIQQNVQAAINFLIDQQRQLTIDLPANETIVRLADLQLVRDTADPRKLFITVKVTTADLQQVDSSLTIQTF